MSKSKKIARVIVEFYEGNEDQYEIVVSTRKRTLISQSDNDVPEKNQQKQPILPKKNDRSCKKECTCVSFYNLHQRVTERDIIRLCSDFGNVKDHTVSMWHHYTRKSMFVWMETSSQAEKVISEYDGRTLDNRVLKVMKGHFHDAKVTTNKKSLPKNVTTPDLDKELEPKRESIPQKVIDVEKLAQLDREIDDYMSERKFLSRYDEYVEHIARGGRPDKSKYAFKTVWEQSID